MNNPNPGNRGTEPTLRKRAEAAYQAGEALPKETSQTAMSPEAAQQIIHELRVHQIELEIQNDELRRAQGELEASRSRYFDLYDMAPVGYCTVSESGLVLEANFAVSTLLGLTRGALVGQPFSRFILKADQYTYYRFRKQLFATDEQAPCELRMVKLDGTPCWTRLEATTAQDAVGAPVGRMVLTDITERKRAEEVQTFLAQASPERSDASFFNGLARFLAQSLQMDYVCIDRLEGDQLTAQTLAVWNDGHFEDNVAYALKDTPCGDVVGQTVCCFPAKVCQHFPRDAALQILRAESYVGVTLFSHTGQPIGLIAVIGRSRLTNRAYAEATLKLVAGRAAGELERFQQEEALKRSQEAFQGYFEMGSLGMCVTSPEKGWLEVNERLCQMLGYSKAELTGLTWAQLTHHDDLGADLHLFAEVMAGKRDRYELDKRFIRKDGSVVHTTLSVACQRNADGTVDHFLASLNDITERKKAETALESSLREKVALLNEVHHRVKNNLQVITSLLRMEARRSDHLAAKSVLKEMQGRIMSMATLHAALCRTGTFASVDLGAYLRELSSQSFRASVVRPGSVRLQLELTSVQVEMDQAQPCGLLVNELISNCLKHGFPGDHTGEVRVELQLLDGGPQLRLRVIDTGVGLPADFESKRAKSLGLQLVSDMAGQIDGRLEIGSGPGAVFDVIFTPKHSEPNPSTPPS